MSSAAFKAHIGWANVAVDAGVADRPAPRWAGRIELFGDSPPREVMEPYHLAGGWQVGKRVTPPPDPGAVVAAARRRQDQLATQTLRAWFDAHGEPEIAVLLVRRGIVHDLEGTLANHAHVHVAECDAVRDALYHGLRTLGVDVIRQDEKSVPDAAAERLGCRPAECDAVVKALKPRGVRHWSKEERSIALAAWLHARR